MSLAGLTNDPIKPSLTPSYAVFRWMMQSRAQHGSARSSKLQWTGLPGRCIREYHHSSLVYHPTFLSFFLSSDTSITGYSSIFLNALTHSLRTSAPTETCLITAEIWGKALRESLDVLGKYTPAQRGDRTVIDALQPFVQVLQWTGDVQHASHAAATGAQMTKKMRPNLGRSVYIGGDTWRDVPDPGAYGLSVFLQAISQTFSIQG